MVYYSNKIPQGNVRAEGMHVQCDECSNDVTTNVKWFIEGVWAGFMGKPLVGKRTYYHVCPICQNLIQQLTKSQVDALRAR